MYSYSTKHTSCVGKLAFTFSLISRVESQLCAEKLAKTHDDDDIVVAAAGTIRTKLE